ncbi:MAG: GAF domain-containing protein [Alphaproteobacteria bacterium]|nr:GAF domain-containing protein [Alphaproteobacteria bacterium]
MKAPAIPANEAARLAALQSYHVLDTPAEKPFDDIARLAAHILDVPIALVSLIDSDRQWFKARYGLDATETSREVSFCGHVVAAGETMLIADAALDERFKDNPLVTGGPMIRSYCGIPLKTARGDVLGTLCALDSEPHTFSPQQVDMIAILADRVMAELELRRELVFRRQFSTAVDHSPYFLALANLEGKPFYLNATARAWLGVAKDGPMPTHIADWHVEAMKRFVREDLIAQAIADGRWAGGTTYMRDGIEIAVDESVHAEPATDQYPGYIAVGALERTGG